MTHYIAHLLTEALNVVPWWLETIEDYDRLEGEYSVHQPANGSVSDKTSCEICKPHEADFWSVYGRFKVGYHDCFRDFAMETEARAFAAGLR